MRPGAQHDAKFAKGGSDKMFKQQSAGPARAGRTGKAQTQRPARAAKGGKTPMADFTPAKPARAGRTAVR
jgi:hypothetical protein